MATIPEALAIALAHHHAGHLADAELIYRQIIAAEPNYVPAHVNLGAVQHALGQLDLAIASYRRALELNPALAEAHYNLGNACRDQGRLADAAEAYSQAVSLRPDYAEAHLNLGIAWLGLEQPQQAAPCFLRALELQPDLAQAHNSLGSALHAQGELQRAIASYRRAIELAPDFAPAHCNLGLALLGSGNTAEAISSFHRAIDLAPDFAEAHNNLGNAYQNQLRLAEARASYRRAIDLKPEYPDAHYNLGLVLHEQGNLEEALICNRRAIDLRPDFAPAHIHEAELLLLGGDYARGWREFEWRLNLRNSPSRLLEGPRWDGKPVAGKTVLLQAEQGLGDTIQFVRYAALVKERGAHVILRCQTALLPLLTSCPGVDELIGNEDSLPPFDFQAPLLSLPAILGDAEIIPARVPYLSADPKLVANWREKLEVVRQDCEPPSPEPRTPNPHPRAPSPRPLLIGIAWQGNPKYPTDRHRSIALSEFIPLAQIPGARLVSLQKGDGTEQLVAHKGFVLNLGPDLDLGPHIDNAHGPFMDTAAIMQNLDLVITSDTAIAHLAGALAVPTWLALPFIPDWRWHLHRTDSPWYPTLRLFRQKTPGDWPTVFQDIASALQDITQARSASEGPGSQKLASAE